MDDEAVWDQRYATADLIWTANANQSLIESVDDLDPGTALDLACGEGRNAVWLAQQGWRVLAVDFSRVGLEKGATLATSAGVEVRFEHHDATTWEPVETFDLVTVLYLQLPEPERSRALEIAANSVAPGGTLLVVAHDLENLTKGIGGPRSSEYLYAVSDTEALATRCGLDVVRAQQVIRMVSTAEGDRPAIDTLVLAERPHPEPLGPVRRGLGPSELFRRLRRGLGRGSTPAT